ncbi:hypothetical protein DRO97_10010 [Archaeoglobales archaeon]|nr:MAG: hypothetical protein DRO97_10010 [Archaeoglobales archaeon]
MRFIILFILLIAIIQTTQASPQDVVGEKANMIFSNLKITMEDYILLIIALGTMIFAMKNVTMGLGAGTILYAATLILFYEAGLMYIKAFIAFMVALILLIMTLFIGYQKETKFYV